MSKSKLPGSLSFCKRIQNSDGHFYNEIGGDLVPILVTKQLSMGTQGHAGAVSVGLPLGKDVARLSPDADALIIQFSIRFLPVQFALHSCAGSNVAAAAVLRARITDFLNRAVSSNCLQVIADRFARNIVNGRWLWRNQSVGGKIGIKVSSGSGLDLTFDATKIDRSFESPADSNELLVAQYIHQCLAGSAPPEALSICARIEPGIRFGCEVYPSQRFLDTTQGQRSRVLYKTHGEIGQAALRDDKIANAIRCIDTWYPAYSEFGQPTPIEPLGANLMWQVFLRQGPASAVDILRKIGEVDPESNDGLFLMGCFIRGGVFGETDK